MVSQVVIISISRYHDIDRLPCFAAISWDRLSLRYRAKAINLVQWTAIPRRH